MELDVVFLPKRLHQNDCITDDGRKFLKKKAIRESQSSVPIVTNASAKACVYPLVIYRSLTF